MEYRKIRDSHHAQLMELEKRQHEYHNASTRIPNGKVALRLANYKKGIERLRKERNELRAQISVANGASYYKDNARNYESIQCHVDCQENLQEKIDQMKKSITNTERAMTRLDREISVLSRKTVPEAQYELHADRARKRLAMLENQWERNVRQECCYETDNNKLREEVKKLVVDRAIFNTSYMKAIKRMTSDRKYLVDLIEYAIGTFENCVDIYDRMHILLNKDGKDSVKYIADVAKLIREAEAEAVEQEFLNGKSVKRPLADLPPKEYRRREELYIKLSKRINLYDKVMTQIRQYSNSKDYMSVIAKFREQEDLYYSYFNYENEVSHHVTLVDLAAKQLKAELETLRFDNKEELLTVLGTIDELQKTYISIQRHNLELSKQRVTKDKSLQKLLNDFEEIFEICRTDASPLMDQLGDHSHIHLRNIPTILKILEKRIFGITSCVYVIERLDESRPYSDYTVQQLHKRCEWPTALGDIVLTQQCPECAEGDVANMEEAGDTAAQVSTLHAARKKLHDKVVQPEMQYRLHNITDCKLPRSRMLAANRNM